MSSPTPLSSSRWSTKDLNGDGGVIKTVLQDGESWEQPKAEDEVRVEYKVYYNKELVLSSPEGGMEFCSKDPPSIEATYKDASRCTFRSKRAKAPPSLNALSQNLICSI